jgi:hypothetical protein
MHRFNHRVTAVFIVLVWLIAGACSTTSTSSDSKDRTKSSFDNFLVIGVAGDYTNRAQFERTLVSALRSKGVDATTYYSLVSGNQALERDVIVDAVRTHGFDAVLLTRVLSQEVAISETSGSSETLTTRKDGSLVNFFRYDYDELNKPATIDLTTTTVLATELFSATSEEMIWSTEYKGASMENVGQIIKSSVDTIVKRLNRERLISR